jgi:hypothetical protein
MSPVFRDREKPGRADPPLRMVLDDETVERLQTAAARYGLEVEELMVALLQAGAEHIGDLLGEPPTSRHAN